MPVFLSFFFSVFFFRFFLGASDGERGRKSKYFDKGNYYKLKYIIKKIVKLLFTKNR